MEEKIEELRKALEVLDAERKEIYKKSQSIQNLLNAKNIEALKINAQIEVLEELKNGK